MAEEIKTPMSEFDKVEQVKDTAEFILLQDGVNARVEAPVFEQKLLDKTNGRYLGKTETAESAKGSGGVTADNELAVSGKEVNNSIKDISNLNYSLLLGLNKGGFEKGGIDSVTGKDSPSDRFLRSLGFISLPKNSNIKIFFKNSDLKLRYLLKYSSNGVIISRSQEDTFTTDSSDVMYRFTVSKKDETNITDDTLVINTAKMVDLSNMYPNFDNVEKVLYKDFNTSEIEFGGYRYQNGEKAVNFLRLRTKDAIKLNKGTYFIDMHKDYAITGVVFLKDGVYVSGVETTNIINVDDTFNEVLLSFKHKTIATINYQMNLDFYCKLLDYTTLSTEYKEYPLKGKSIMGFGSSNLTNEYGTWLQDLGIAKKMIVSYKAVAGAKFGTRSTNTYKSVTQQVEEYINEGLKSDYIIISSGMNDNWHNPKSPIGDWEVVKSKSLDEIRSTLEDSSFGISTIYGSLKYIFEKLIPYQKGTKIILNIPFQCWTSRYEAFLPLKEALITVAKYYSIPTMNSLDNGVIANVFEIQDSSLSLCTIDGIHTRKDNIINEYGRRVQYDFAEKVFLNF